MTASPFEAGDFVWCNFPVSEAPFRPGLLHATYTIAITGVAGIGPAAFVAYTTSQMRPPPSPQGVLQFGAVKAEEMGHNRPFQLYAGRIAYVPITSEYFPFLNRPDHGILGRAPLSIQQAISAAAKELGQRRPESVERLGPLWPKPR